MRLTRCSLRASIEAIWLGRLSYGDALKLQRKFVDKLVQAKEAKTECPVKFVSLFDLFSVCFFFEGLNLNIAKNW